MIRLKVARSGELALVFMSIGTTMLSLLGAAAQDEVIVGEALLPNASDNALVIRQPDNRTELEYVVRSPDRAERRVKVTANEALVRVDDRGRMERIRSSDPAIHIESLGTASRYWLIRVNERRPMTPGGVVQRFTQATGVKPDAAEPNLIGTLTDAQDRQYEWSAAPWAHLNRGGLGVVDADVDGSEALSRVAAFPPNGLRQPIIMMIDSSLDVNHPALRPALWRNPGEVPGDGRDNDGNGYRDDVHGWNFVDGNGSLLDAESHGTHVAGILVATPPHASGAVRGLGQGARLMTAKVGFRPSSANVTRAINYAIEEDASIITMSLSFNERAAALDEAVEAAEQRGILTVASAGNDGVDIRQAPTFPCMSPNVICVGMSDYDDRLDPRSNWGASQLQTATSGVAIAAPGVAVRSTIPGGGYGEKDGTSMATPMVAGALALTWRVHPTATHNEVRHRVLRTADMPTSLPLDRVEQGRRLNVYRALYGRPYDLDWSTDYCNVPVYDPSTNQRHPRRTNYPFANSDEPGIDGLSPANAFTICTVAQMVNIQGSMLDRFFVLRSDLAWREDLTGSWPYSIGGRMAAPGVFTGVLDGDGHTIMGFSQGLKKNSGLIARLGLGGRVTNLRFMRAQVTATMNAGVVAVSVEGGRIDNVQVDGAVSGFSAGGLVGELRGGTINMSSFEGRVEGQTLVGGLAGTASERGSVIGSSVFSGVVDAPTTVGGLAGKGGYGLIIRNSYASVLMPERVSGGRTIAGGLVGMLLCRGRIENSYSEGFIEANSEAGGLVGRMIDADIDRAYASVLIWPGAPTAGGAVGEIKDGLMSDSQRYLCSDSSQVPPPSTRNEDFFDLAYGRAGFGTGMTRQALRSPATFSAWPDASWDKLNGYFPRLRRLPRSTHPDY